MSIYANLGDADFDQVVSADQALPILVDCWSPGAEACRYNAPQADELSRALQGRLLVAKLNLDDNPWTAARQGIKVAPCLLLYVQGRLAHTFYGVVQPGQVEAVLEGLS